MVYMVRPTARTISITAKATISARRNRSVFFILGSMCIVMTSKQMPSRYFLFDMVYNVKQASPTNATAKETAVGIT